jgi:hypothetical protein
MVSIFSFIYLCQHEINNMLIISSSFSMSFFLLFSSSLKELFPWMSSSFHSLELSLQVPIKLRLDELVKFYSSLISRRENLFYFDIKKEISSIFCCGWHLL